MDFGDRSRHSFGHAVCSSGASTNARAHSHEGLGGATRLLKLVLLCALIAGTKPVGLPNLANVMEEDAHGLFLV